MGACYDPGEGRESMNCTFLFSKKWFEVLFCGLKRLEVPSWELEVARRVLDIAVQSSRAVCLNEASHANCRLHTTDDLSSAGHNYSRPPIATACPALKNGVAAKAN